MTFHSVSYPTSGQSVFDFSSIRSQQIGKILAEFSRVLIELPSHEAIFGKFDEMRATGVATVGEAQSSMTIISVSSSGKSTIAKAYRNRALQAESDTKKVRVVYVSVADMSTTKDVSTRILREVKDQTIGTKFYLRERILWVFRFLGVELLILDEVHHLLGMNNSSEVVNFFKSLLNDGLCPIVFVGTEAAESIFLGDGAREMAQRRSHSEEIVPLEANDHDLRLYASFLRKMDAWLIDQGIFDQTSDFIDDFSLECLFEASKGYIGWTARILQSALRNALRRHATRIEFYDLALAVDKWTLNQRTMKHNPFRGGNA